MWPFVGSAIIGIWLMMSPGIFHYADIGQVAFHVIGPLVATFGIMACWQITRGVRWVNVALALFLLTTPWVLASPKHSTINSLISGAILLFLSLQEGKRTHPFGGGWSSLWK